MLNLTWSGIEKVIMFSSIFIAGWIYLELKSLNASLGYS